MRPQAGVSQRCRSCQQLEQPALGPDIPVARGPATQNASNDPLYGHWGYNHTFTKAYSTSGYNCAFASKFDQ